MPTVFYERFRPVQEVSLTPFQEKKDVEEMDVLDEVDILTRKLSPQTAMKIREKTTKCRQIILKDCNRNASTCLVLST